MQIIRAFKEKLQLAKGTLATQWAYASLMSRRGEATSAKVIGLFVGAFLFAILMPIAFSQIFTTNTTVWDQTTVTVFKLVPVIVVVAFVVGIIYAITRE